MDFYPQTLISSVISVHETCNSRFGDKVLLFDDEVLRQKCGNHDSTKVSVTRRVCGYLGSPDASPFNAWKQKEVKHLPNF